MAFTVDYTTTVGKVRALTGDVDANIPFMSDEEVQVFIDLESSGHLKLIAASVLLAMAAKNAIILKKITALDLSMDGPAVADSLRRLAAEYRSMAEKENESYIEFCDVIPPPLDWAAVVWGLPSEAKDWV